MRKGLPLYRKVDVLRQYRLGMELRKASGLEKDIADMLHDALLPSIKGSLPGFPDSGDERPFYALSLPPGVMDTLHSKGVELRSKELAARTFNTEKENLSCERQYGIAYPKHKKPVTQKPVESSENKVIVILALGELTKSRGLPAFNKMEVPLESGKLLSAPLSVYQTFQGHEGGGLGYIWIWGYKPSEPRKPVE